MVTLPQLVLVARELIVLPPQIIREAAEGSGQRPSEGPGEGGLCDAVWRLHEPERDQSQRDV